MSYYNIVLSVLHLVGRHIKTWYKLTNYFLNSDSEEENRFTRSCMNIQISRFCITLYLWIHFLTALCVCLFIYVCTTNSFTRQGIMNNFVEIVWSRKASCWKHQEQINRPKQIVLWKMNDLNGNYCTKLTNVIGTLNCLVLVIITSVLLWKGPISAVIRY